MQKHIDEQAFLRAYDEYADALFRYCYYRTYDREKAKDLMHDTFTNAWSYLRQGKEITNLRAFLYRSAHNACVNEALRSKPLSIESLQEASHYDPADEGLSPQDEAERSELLDRLAELDADDRDLLVLRYMDGLQVKEIAAVLDENPNTISVRIRRALRTLREKIEPTP